MYNVVMTFRFNNNNNNNIRNLVIYVPSRMPFLRSSRVQVRSQVFCVEGKVVIWAPAIATTEPDRIAANDRSLNIVSSQ